MEQKKSYQKIHRPIIRNTTIFPEGVKNLNTNYNWKFSKIKFELDFLRYKLVCSDLWFFLLKISSFSKKVFFLRLFFSPKKNHLFLGGLKLLIPKNSFVDILGVLKHQGTKPNCIKKQKMEKIGGYYQKKKFKYYRKFSEMSYHKLLLFFSTL